MVARVIYKCPCLDMRGWRIIGCYGALHLAGASRLPLLLGCPRLLMTPQQDHSFKYLLAIYMREGGAEPVT